MVASVIAPPHDRPGVAQNPNLVMTKQKGSVSNPLVKGAKMWEKRVAIGEDFPLQQCTMREPIKGRNDNMLFPVSLKETGKSTVVPAGLAVLLISEHSDLGEIKDNKDGTYDIISFDLKQLGRVRNELIVA